MLATHRNNRLVPVVIITTCFWLFYLLIDPSIENFGTALPRVRQQRPDTSPTQETTVDFQPSPAPIRIKPQPPVSGAGRLTTDDVLLIVKTGGTTIWKRLLIHLITTLSPERINPNNIVIYSDNNQTIGGFSVIDVLANTTEATRSRPDFDVYRAQADYDANNAYVEAAGLAGDEWGPTGGWIIDKYKFVPLMEHAGTNWPTAKWYIYVEDDAYLFLPNVLAYLDKFDWEEPHYLGHYSAKSDVVFAHGGAGFALSRGAWEKSFGTRNGKMAEEWEEYTAGHCCGDQVLGKVLNEYGVKFGENDGDEKFTWGFNPLVHWAFAFSRWNWCEPLMSFHKVHSRDIASYYELERQWDFTKPLLHRDFFAHEIAPALKQRVEWWDNQSNMYAVSSANKNAPPAPAESSSPYDATAWANAWESVDACEAACRSWKDCVQWAYVEDLCRMDDKAVMGQGYAPSMSQRKTALMTTSGWIVERLENWTCNS